MLISVKTCCPRILLVVLFVPVILSSLLRPEWLVGTNFGVAGINASYDYLVLGGGTAGLTIATRLAQSGSFSVAVVEAGGFHELEGGNVTQIPAFWSRGTQQTTTKGVNPLTDWLFNTTPQPGANGRVFHYARGKCLGGSSARNTLAYQRATVGSMEKRAEQVGDNSYFWENVLLYYMRSVHFTPPNNRTIPANATVGYDDSAFDADGGPLQVSYPNYLASISEYGRAAFNELGLPGLSQGFQSGELIGHQYGEATIDPMDETRSSSESSFLRLALQETNLIVHTHTLAKRILFDDQKRATGALVKAGGVTFQLIATEEVIVSCGAFQSPQLLMVSGVGPTEALQKYGIPIVADRPGVGQDLQDHVIYGPSHVVNLQTAAIIENPEYEEDIINEYLVNKTGPLTNTGTDYNGYDKISTPAGSNISAATMQALSIFPADWPEAEWLVGSTYLGLGLGPPDNKNYASVLPALLALLSTGNVTIASSDTSDPPVINPQWLTNPADQEIAVAAFKRARAMFATEAMRPVLIGDEV